MMRRIIICMLVLMAVAVFMPATSLANSEAEMTVYDQVIKDGNTVYCAGAKGIYKVKVKNGKVKSSKILIKEPNPYYVGSIVKHMSLYGDSIFYNCETNAACVWLCKGNIKTKKKKILCGSTEDDVDYAIQDNLIYYSCLKSSDYDLTRIYKVMNLDGTGEKDTSVEPLMFTEKSNANGYSMKIKKGKKKIVRII